MAVDVSLVIEINCPRERVAAYAGDPDNVAAWYVNIKSVEWQTEPPMVLGSRIAFVARFLGQRLAYTYEVVAFSPGERLVMQTSQGPFPMETSYTWESVSPSVTRMTLRNRGKPSGFSRLMGVLMVPAMRRANRKDLALLKQILEAESQ